jgi:hypothetical protein
VPQPQPHTEINKFIKIDKDGQQIITSILPPKTKFTYLKDDSNKEKILQQQEQYKIKQKDELINKSNKKSKSATTPTNHHKLKKLNHFRASSVRVKTSNDKNPVKLTTAAVLREEHLIRKQGEEIIKNYTQLEEGARDASEFFKWQNDGKMNAMRNEMAKLEKLKLESKLSYEEAILARENMKEENRLKAQLIQQQTNQLMNDLNDKKERENIEKMAHVIQIIANEKKIKYKMEQVVNSKKEIAKEVTRRNKQLEEEAIRIVI